MGFRERRQGVREVELLKTLLGIRVPGETPATDG